LDRKQEIINDLAQQKTVEKIVAKLLPSSRNPFDCPDDLTQLIYLILLEKSEDLIVSLYEKGEIGFYILKVVRNQLLSKSSGYFYTYIKLRSQSDDISKAETRNSREN